jgi:serine/threonine protein kinase/DNA-binding SARP family transcriptional activator/WD40 repeat protein
MTAGSVATRNFRFRLLGPVVAVRDGAEINLGGEKQRAVFGMLLGRAGETVDRDVLIEGVWGEGATDANRGSLHTYVSNLRALTGLEISRSGSAYALKVDRDQVDKFAFEEAVEQAQAALSTSPDEAAELLRTALGWWRGRPYANVADAPGLQSDIRRLEELRLHAVQQRIEADLAGGRHGKLIPELEALIAEHPLLEAFRFQQMLALYRAGRQSDAVRAYRRTEEYLAEETGLEPSPELRDLEMRILQHDESLLVGLGQAVTERRAFLFTDIEGSTRLWDMHPDAMGRALSRHDEILGAAISSAGGATFKHTGDGLLAAFPSVRSAVTAAEDAQRSLQGEDWGVLDDVKVRMGIDVGDVDVRGNDFFGPPLNRCARIMSAGYGGQVLLSLSAQEDLTHDPIEGVQVRYLGEHRLRGLGDVERIGQLVFIGLPADFPELRLFVGGPDLTAPDFGDSLRGYELREQIGEGTFGVVYRAYQPSVGREVAIKVIRPEFANHPAFVRRFESEARLVAQLEHPFIVPLFDYWRDQDGAYLVMRLMRGGTLRSAMDSSWTPPDTLALLRQVGGALGAAHRQGVVHRDFKPGNILLDDEGNAYLADFGIAARIMDPTEVGPIPSSAQRYRAPEETRGLPADHRSDLFSLSVLTYELLTGTRVSDQPRPITEVRPDLPEALNAVIAQGTAPTTGDRFSSADAFLESLTEALGDLVELPTEPPSRTEARNPFKGLRPFSESDQGDFFGRDGLVETLISAMQRQPLITVVGPSGSGKSSVVRAGLLPRLRGGGIPGSENWLYVTFTPGTHPFDSLADALGSVATRQLPELADRLTDGALAVVATELLDGLEGDLLLVVDQFEEIFTQVDDEEIRDRFLRQLTEAVEAAGSRVRVLATLRADFFDRPLAYEHIGPHVSAGHVTVIPPTRTELVEAIEKPALAVGLRFEPGLAARIVSDVAEQPGGLPLMQYALTELVETRGIDVLTAADYDQIGGVTGALGRRAEQVYQDLSPARQEAARQIFLRLVTVDENADDTRRRAKRSELEALDLDHHAVTEVADAFGRHRLLSFDRDATTRSPTVEVAHESLLRQWPRLRAWIEEQRDGLVLGRRFDAAMADWNGADRADDYLLTGDRLAPFTHWATTASLTSDEQAFMRASRQAEASAGQARQRRRRVLTGVLASATAVSLAFGAFAFVQRGEAQDSAAQAEQQAGLAKTAAGEAEQSAALAVESAAVAEQRAAEAQAAESLATARELAASAIGVLDEDPELAALLTLEAIDATPPGVEQPVEVINALWQAGAASRLIGTIEHGYGGPTFLDLSADGTRLAVVGTEGNSVRMYNPITDFLLWEHTEETADSFTYPAFSPDGALVAVPAVDSLSIYSARKEADPDELPNRIVILDVGTGQPIETLAFPYCLVAEVVSWSPDGAHMSVSTGPPGCPREDAPDGLWVEVFDTATWQPVALLTFPKRAFEVNAAFDEDGRLYVFSDAGKPRIFSAGDYQLIATIDDASGATGAVSPDGTSMALFNNDQEIGVFLIDTATGARVDRLTPLDAVPTPPLGTRYSPDGKYVILATDGAAVVVFDVASGKRLFRLPGSQAERAAFDVDRSILYSSHNDGKVRIWDLGSGAFGRTPVGNLGEASWVRINSFSFGPDLAAFEPFDRAAFEGFVGFFDPATGELVGEQVEGQQAVALPDGRFAFTRMPDAAQIIYDPRSGEEQALISCPTEDFVTCSDTGDPLPFYGLRISIDGSELAAVTTRGVATIFDPGTGSVIGEERHELDGTFLETVLFSDNWILVSTGTAYAAIDRSTGDELWRAEAFVGERELSHSRSVAAFDERGVVRIVDLEAWEDRVLEHGFGRIQGLAFSPDDQRLAVADEDRIAFIDLPSGDLIQTVPAQNVSDLYWIDEAEVLIGTTDGVWATMSLDVDALILAAREGAARQLSDQECLTYRIDPCGSESG